MRQQKHGGGKREQRRTWAQDRADGRRQAKAITGANRRQQEVNSEGQRTAWARLRLRTVSCERMRTDCGLRGKREQWEAGSCRTRRDRSAAAANRERHARGAAVANHKRRADTHGLRDSAFSRTRSALAGMRSTRRLTPNAGRRAPALAHPTPLASGRPPRASSRAGRSR